jgi:hypothetical protein
MWSGMSPPRVVARLLFASLLLPACASRAPVPPLPLVGFARSLASETLSAELASQPEGGLVATGAPHEIVITDADGMPRRELVSGLDLAPLELRTAARGLGNEAGALRWEWLATLSQQPQAELSVLSIHDAQGRLVHEEVLREDCTSLSWRVAAAPELLVGCTDRVWRYQPDPAHKPELAGTRFVRSGSFGPVTFGDSRARVEAALRLVGADCRTPDCKLWGLHLDEHDFVLATDFRNDELVRLTVVGPRRARSAWRTKVREDWAALSSELPGGAETQQREYPNPSELAPIPNQQDWSFAETHRAEHDGVKASVGLYSNEGLNGKGFGAIAVITPAAAATTGPVPASAAD